MPTLIRLVLITALLLSTAGGATVEPASQEVQDAFTVVLTKYLGRVFDEMFPGSPADRDQAVASMVRSQKAGDPVFAISEADAKSLLAKGPDDKGNAAIVKANIAAIDKMGGSMSSSYQQMAHAFSSGEMTGGMELEYLRRTSDLVKSKLAEKP